MQMYTCILYMLIRDEKEGRKKQAKQHNTHKAVIFLKDNELPRVGFEPKCTYNYISFLH